MLSEISSAIIEFSSLDNIYKLLLSLGRFYADITENNLNYRSCPDVNLLKRKLTNIIMLNPIGGQRFSRKFYRCNSHPEICEKIIIKESTIEEMCALANELRMVYTNLGTKTKQSRLQKYSSLSNHMDMTKFLYDVQTSQGCSNGLNIIEAQKFQALYNAFSSYMGKEFSRAMKLIDAEKHCALNDENKKIVTRWIKHVLETYEDLLYYLYCEPCLRVFADEPSFWFYGFYCDNIFILRSNPENYTIIGGKRFSTPPGFNVRVKMPSEFAGELYMYKKYIVTSQCFVFRHGFMTIRNREARNEAIRNTCYFYASLFTAIDKMKDQIETTFCGKHQFTGNPQVLNVLWNQSKGISHIPEAVDAKLAIEFLKQLPTNIEITCVELNDSHSDDLKYDSECLVKQFLASFFINGLLHYCLQCLVYIENCIAPYLSQ